MARKEDDGAYKNEQLVRQLIDRARAQDVMMKQEPAFFTASRLAAGPECWAFDVASGRCGKTARVPGKFSIKIVMHRIYLKEYTALRCLPRSHEAIVELVRDHLELNICLANPIVSFGRQSPRGLTLAG